MSTTSPTRTVAAMAAVMAAGLALGACSTADLYANVQGWQHQECLRLPDVAERERCRKSTARSHEQYLAEREALNRPSAAASAAARR